MTPRLRILVLTLCVVFIAGWVLIASSAGQSLPNSGFANVAATKTALPTPPDPASRTPAARSYAPAVFDLARTPTILPTPSATVNATKTPVPTP